MTSSVLALLAILGVVFLLAWLGGAFSSDDDDDSHNEP